MNFSTEVNETLEYELLFAKIKLERCALSNTNPNLNARAALREIPRE
jgi:hypothetical protein